MAWSCVILGQGKRATRTNQLRTRKSGGRVPAGHWSTLKVEQDFKQEIVERFNKTSDRSFRVWMETGLKGGLD